MDLIQFNQEALEEEMSIRRAFSVHPSRVLSPLYAKGQDTYHLPDNREVLTFSTLYLN